MKRGGPTCTHCASDEIQRDHAGHAVADPQLEVEKSKFREQEKLEDGTP